MSADFDPLVEAGGAGSFLHGVQTAQEEPKPAAPWWESWPVPFAVLAADRRVRVATPGSDREKELRASGYSAIALFDSDVVEPRACKCGCGLPCPVGQAYADTDFCRKREYIYFRPQIDLRGMDRPGAERAMALVGEAIRAAKLGQRRATVDVQPVQHKTEVRADRRPSNRIRLDAAAWEALQEIRAFWMDGCPTATVRRLIEQERERIESLQKQEESHG